MDKSQELFDAIRLIARNEIEKQSSTDTVIGTVIERVESSDAYKVSYQNIEILASSMGGRYNAGDSVYVMLPKGRLDGVKFIIGKTNDRTPTITTNANGLSDSTLGMIQDIINNFNDLISDNKVTPVEKQSLQVQWEQIKKSYQEILNNSSPYPEIDLTGLNSKYKTLESLMNVILGNMETTTEVDGNTVRQVLSNYLTEDTSVRVLIQEALRNEITYKVDIVSTNGESFKNGVINTILKVIAMRGKKTITSSFEPENIRWYKMKDDGSILPNWSRTGKSIPITSEDVDIKQVFVVQLYVEEAMVAQDTITIVDLNDIENIKLSLTPKLSRTQTFDPTTKNIIPDYTIQNQVIQAKTLKGADDITSLVTHKWYYNGELITNDGRFEIQNNALFIKRNLMDSENPTMMIDCKVSYYSEEYNLTLEDSLSLDFSYVSNGEDGEDGKNALLVNVLHPYGTTIKNKQQSLLLVSLQAYFADKDVLSLLSNRKWFYADESVNSSSPYYDKDGGVGWSLISETNNLNGALNGYDTNILSISGNGFNGSISIKVVAYFEEFKGAATTTLIDSTDPITGVILGNTQLKNGEPTSLQIEAYLGQMKITDTSNYTFVWNLELVDNSSRIIGPMEPFTKTTVWPKYGESIILEWGDIPENDNVYVTCKIYRNE